MELLDLVVFNNRVRTWLVALLVGVATAVTIQLTKRLLLHRLKPLTQRTSTRLDDGAMLAVEKTNSFIVALLSIYVGILVLKVPLAFMEWISAVAFIGLLLQVGIWGDRLVRFWFAQEQDLALVERENARRATTINAVSFVVRLVLFSILILVALDNIPGVEITALLAGLGVGGVAVALAVQNILGDLFASLSIALDKPFVIGDFIEVGQYKGTVEHIGLKTTRVRSMFGEELIFANGDLLESRIQNFRDMQERRVSFQIGVTYDTPPGKLRQIPAMVTEIIESQEPIRFDRVHFFNFGSYSLDFEIVYFVLSPDFKLYMDIQQQINLAMLEQFAAAGIEFAFPTQTLHLAGAPERSAVRTEVVERGNGRNQVEIGD
jgi:small-conductance mechanosensitive channel